MRRQVDHTAWYDMMITLCGYNKVSNWMNSGSLTALIQPGCHCTVWEYSNKTGGDSEVLR